MPVLSVKGLIPRRRRGDGGAMHREEGRGRLKLKTRRNERKERKEGNDTERNWYKR